jgi:hypothetical protein
MWYRDREFAVSCEDITECRYRLVCRQTIHNMAMKPERTQAHYKEGLKRNVNLRLEQARQYIQRIQHNIEQSQISPRVGTHT